MTIEEMGKIMSILAVAYPKYYSEQTKEEKKQALILWYSMMGDYPADLVANAVKAVIAKSVFPPAIAEVMQMINDLQNNCQEMTELEAWGYVSKAIRSSAYRAKEAWEGLPAQLQKCVTPDMLRVWAAVGTGEVETVVQSNFNRTYRAMLAQQKQYDALPASVKEFTKQLSEQKAEDTLSITED